MSGFISGLLGGYANTMLAKKRQDISEQHRQEDNEVSVLQEAIKSGNLTPEATQAAFDRMSEIVHGKAGKKKGPDFGALIGRFGGGKQQQGPTGMDAVKAKVAAGAPAPASAGAPPPSGFVPDATSPEQTEGKGGAAFSMGEPPAPGGEQGVQLGAPPAPPHVWMTPDEKQLQFLKQKNTEFEKVTKPQLEFEHSLRMEELKAKPQAKTIVLEGKDEQGNSIPIIGWQDPQSKQILDSEGKPIANPVAWKDQAKAKQMQAYYDSRAELNRAQADLAKAKNDPKSPLFQQAERRVQIAEEAMRTNRGALSLREQQYELSLENAQFRWFGPTANVRTRGQVAGQVRDHMPELEAQLNKLSADGKLGPLAGRFEEFMTGQVGADDPEYAAFRANLGMFKSGTVMAHFGARGGVQMLDYFKQLIDSGKHGPGNIRATLGQLDSYLKTYEEGGKYTPRNPRLADQSKVQTPRNASDEVFAADGKTLIGHVVNGKYVPLKK